MEKYTEKEINSIVNKMLKNRDYYKLLCFLNDLYNFAKLPENIVDKLISEDNKACASEFLENEDLLYFLSQKKKDKLKKFLNAREVNIKLNKPYEYYYELLFANGVRLWNTKKIDDTVEHTFTRYNKPIKIRLKEIKEDNVLVSCVIYSNYDLSEDEQILKAIDYINEFGFNIDRNINNDSIIK